MAAPGFLKRIWTKPPVVFPWVGVFHVWATLHAFWLFFGDGFDLSGLAYPFGSLCYTVAWLFLCDLRKWAAFAYIGLTSLNLALRFLVHPFSLWADFSNVLFPADIIFCFLILVYYKRLGAPREEARK